MALSQERTYTIDDIYALPEGQRAELIDGQMYMTAPPRTIHQRISSALHAAIYQYVKSEKGSCEVFAAPFAVFVNADDKNYVEPDISVICDKDKLDEYGCKGAPDWIIEIVSPSDSHRDYGIKLFILHNDFTCRETRLHNADWFNRMITLGSIQRYAV